MKIYKVEETDLFGYPSFEKFFTTIESAKKLYMERYDKHANSIDLVENDHLDSEEYQEKPITEIEKGLVPNLIQGVSFALWYRSSYEYEEYDINLIELKIIEIEVYEN